MPSRNGHALSLGFAQDASLEDVLSAVEIIYRSTGCSPCGRLSFLVKNEEIVDPAISELRAVPSLETITHVGEQASAGAFG